MRAVQPSFPRLMMKKMKRWDWIMMVLSVLWVITTDFRHMTSITWLGGVALLIYIIRFALKMSRPTP